MPWGRHCGRPQRTGRIVRFCAYKPTAALRYDPLGPRWGQVAHTHTADRNTLTYCSFRHFSVQDIIRHLHHRRRHNGSSHAHTFNPTSRARICCDIRMCARKHRTAAPLAPLRMYLNIYIISSESATSPPTHCQRHQHHWPGSGHCCCRRPAPKLKRNILRTRDQEIDDDAPHTHIHAHGRFRLRYN